MGNFVLHRALQNMSSWRKAGVRLVPMSLNVAPAQLQRGELQSTIATLLKTHGFRPELLQLEMTERAMFDSHVPAGENRQDTMARLRDLGVKEELLDQISKESLLQLDRPANPRKNSQAELRAVLQAAY